MIITRGFISFLTLLALARFCDAARILGIMPVPSYSHHVAFRSLWKTLAQRGHEVILITTDPARDPSSNVTEIDISELYNIRKDFDYVNSMKRCSTWMQILTEIVWPMTYEVSKRIFKHPEVRKLYEPNSGYKFDVVISEYLIQHATYTFAHLFNAPLIGVASTNLYSMDTFLLGGPLLPGHHSSFELEDRVSEDTSFWQRVNNFCELWYYTYRHQTDFLPKQQAIVDDYFGKDAPSLLELTKNVPVILTTEHKCLSVAKPMVPKIIQIGPLHLSKEILPIPAFIENFLGDGDEGFIYVSFGTNVDFEKMNPGMKHAVFDVLSKLPCKVLFKYSGKLPQHITNVLASKWFPQQAILAHPKIKGFLYQGGFQSTVEAIYRSIPLIIVPVSADQVFYATRLESLGVGRKISYKNINAKELDEAIRDVLLNKKYKENVIKLHEIMEDVPIKPMDHAVWWIEYIIRHRDAPHLHNSLADEPWYKRYDMDVIAFLSVVIFIVITCILIMTLKCILYLLRRHQFFVTAKKIKIS